MCHFDGYHTHLVTEPEASGLALRDAGGDTALTFPARALLMVYSFIAVVGGGVVMLAGWLN